MKTRVKRAVALLVPPNEQGLNGVIRITQHKQVEHYYVDLLNVDFGRGFVVEQISSSGPEHRYEVVIDGPRSSCTCKGKKYMGRCKHEGALTKLIHLHKI